MDTKRKLLTVIIVVFLVTTEYTRRPNCFASSRYDSSPPDENYPPPSRPRANFPSFRISLLRYTLNNNSNNNNNRSSLINVSSQTLILLPLQFLSDLFITYFSFSFPLIFIYIFRLLRNIYLDDIRININYYHDDFISSRYVNG